MTNLPPDSTLAANLRCIANSMLFAVTVMLPSSLFASMRKLRSSSTTLRRGMSGSMDFVISCMILRFVAALINTPFRRNRKTRPSRKAWRVWFRCYVIFRKNVRALLGEICLPWGAAYHFYRGIIAQIYAECNGGSEEIIRRRKNTNHYRLCSMFSVFNQER